MQFGKYNQALLKGTSYTSLACHAHSTQTTTTTTTNYYGIIG